MFGEEKTDVGNLTMHMLSFLLKFSLEIISIFKWLEKQWKKKDVQYKYYVLILSGKWYRQNIFSYNVLEFMLIRKILNTVFITRIMTEINIYLKDVYNYVCNIHKEILILNMSRVNVSFLADVLNLINPLNNINVDCLS